MVGGMKLSGELDGGQLRRSVEELVRRHEILRTRFEMGEVGELEQVIVGADWAEECLEYGYEDVRWMEEGERESYARRQVKQAGERRFELELGRLLRVVVVRTGEQEHVLGVGLHHVIGDGWSIGVLLHELGEIYGEQSVGRGAGAGEMRLQYGDYAVWQRQRWSGEGRAEQLKYWKQQLSGLEPLELPGDYGRVVEASGEGDRYRFRIGRELTRKLKEASRREGVTLYMQLLGGLQVLLWRYSGQTDVGVGTPVAGRERAELEQMLGCFVNTVVMRTEVGGNPEVGELMRRVREVALGGYMHQEVPFELVVEEVSPERKASRHALFEVMFAMQNTPAAELELGEAKGRELEGMGPEAAKFDLTLTVKEEEGGEELGCELEYARDLFVRETVERMGRHYRRLLEGMAEGGRKRIGELELLGEEEREQIVVEWNRTEREGSWEGVLPEWFEEQARRTPQAVAAVCGERRLSYGELDQSSNRLARYLRKLQVGPETRVGICLERNLEMLVGVLGILKAGGAYVPLDPEYPQERNRDMLVDSGASMLLTSESAEGRVGDIEIRRVRVDGEREAIEQESSARLRSMLSPENLSHVIYTSGSTGKPKGVMIRHSSVVVLVDWALQVFEERSLAAVLASTSLCFDLSVFELFVPLCCGGSTVIVKNALELASAGAEISLINTVPSAMKELLNAAAVPATVTTVNLAGEPLSRELISGILVQQPGVKQVFNLYGPTEDTTYSTFIAFTRERDLEMTVPIGRGIANTRLYVLSAELQPVPVGGKGELYIAGAGVARGYLNRRELTAEKFLPDPFAEAGGRMYRTGDWARYRKDGNLEFLGRGDEQVKIRGYRIELGEIEAGLRGCCGVCEAVVEARSAQGSGGGEKRLVGYVVKGAGARVEWEEVKRKLRERLPDYMVPSVYVELEELPRTANGKIDRKRLPEVEEASGEERRAESGERTPVEELLAGIWEEVLGRRGIGREENFFELGGHSLLATRVMVRVRKVLGVELPLRKMFEQPSIAGLTREVERQQRERGSSGGEEIELRPVERQGGKAEKETGRLPLSYAQQRLWFLEQLEPGSGAYHMVGGMKLSGELDGGQLRRSVEELVRRHEILRTRFEMGEVGELEQVIVGADWAEECLEYGYEDVRWMEEGERESYARRQVKQAGERRFELELGRLLRVVVVRTGEQEHVLGVGLHHVIGDGWSIGVLLHELGEIYGEQSVGRGAGAGEMRLQYGDYAVWQRQRWSGEGRAEQLKYWKQQLSGLEPLELPGDYGRVVEASGEGDRYRFRIGRELTRKLKEASRREGVTLYMQLLGGLQVLLWRYSGQTDVGVGTPVAGRERAELEQMLGCFVNTVVMRTEVGGNPEVGELMRRVREVALGGYMHQEVPFELVVEEVSPERKASRHALFEVMFAMQNTPAAELELGEAKGRELEGMGPEAAKFDLTLTVKEEEGGEELGCELEYARDLFVRETVERMGRHYRRLLEGMAEGGRKRIGELELLGEEEREQIVVEWNRTEREGSWEGVLPEWFEEQARRTPQAVAAVCGERRLSYGELDQSSNRLARYLRKLQVGPETRVGICLERNLEMLVGVLGILKAGGAYLPLDANLPAARLNYMLRDSGAAMVVTRSELLSQDIAIGVQMVCLDQDWKQIISEPVEKLEGGISPQTLAYVIYTSGSTGTPKGVMVQHQGLMNMLRHFQQEMQFGAEDAALATTTLSFDIATVELYLPLITGGRVVVAGPLRSEMQQLALKATQEQISFVQGTPTLWDEVAGQAWDKASPRLRIVCGGEAMERGVAEKLLRTGKEIWNVYGPTETTVWSSTFSVRGFSEAAVSIGRPITNTRMYVLDKNLMPVPVSVAGQLYIGGLGVARGYVNRPDLTAANFIPDPFTQGGSRLYRTGDLAKWMPDGNLQFIGRSDHQVKLRGYRIELPEIEAVLLDHPMVERAVVEVRADKKGNKRLVAYWVARAEKKEGTIELHHFLKNKLPDYMVPSVYVELEELPRTANGKIDRKGLPEVEEAGGEEKESRRQEQTPVEELLAGIWEEVLGRRGIGREENFFELGGHSLLATRVMARVQSLLGVELPLRMFFEAPTIAGLARVLQSNMTLRATQIERRPPGSKAFLNFGQERLRFLHELEPDIPLYNSSAILRLQGDLSAGALQQAFEAVLKRHEILRTGFVENNGSFFQAVRNFVPFALEKLDLHHLPEAEAWEGAKRLARQQAERVFDLTEPPLLRASLAQVSPEQYALAITMHHIITDGWSFQLLVRELAELYTAIGEGRQPSLPELEIQFGDYAAWQREWMEQELSHDQVEYWRQHLAGAPAGLDLPVDWPRPTRRTYEGGLVWFSVEPKLVNELRNLARSEEVTLYMLLLSAFYVFLYRHTGQSDLVVGTPIANRTRPELEPLLGCLVNTLALRIRMQDNPDFRELLGCVREASLGAYSNQSVPFEKIVEVLQPERSLGRQPIFQVMFALQEDPLAGVQFHDVKVEGVRGHYSMAKFDLLLAITQQDRALQGCWEYSSELFERSTMERMAERYLLLLREIAQEPGRRLRQFNMLPDAERMHLLQPVAQGFSFLPCPMHVLFERQAADKPQSIALEWRSQRWTYDKLNRRANQWGNYLRSIGVGVEARVGVCLPRSPELIAVLIGVLKAGGAYVPLDPKYPLERRQYMVANSGAQVVISEVGQMFATGTRVVELERDRDDLMSWSDKAPAEFVDPQCLAYVIYTSGSTGRPKGVAIEHRSAVKFLEWVKQEFERELDGVLATTSVCFDLSIFEIFGPLSWGGRVVLAEDALAINDAATAGLRLINTVPSAMAELVRAGAVPASVTTINLAGEALPAQLVKEIYERTQAKQVWNLYGPSEDTTYSTAAIMPRGARKVSIGNPIADKRAYILDEDLQLLPLGVRGELYLAGVGLARGYLGQPAATAERFLPDNIANIPGQRMYRTGDWARWGANGELEFLGRRDQQVKIRGFRIELGEVEAVLRSHDAVREAVVTVAEISPGEQRIAAYASLKEEGALKPEELQWYAGTLLPEYMVPWSLMILPGLPLTSNGKVDRQALPAPHAKAAEHEYIAPRTEFEEELARIWSELLGVPRVGVEDNFFLLGGHSLLATQAVSRIRQTLDAPLPLRAIFESPTIAALARRLTTTSLAYRLTQKVEVNETHDTVEQEEGWIG